ncbi:MAG TPA: SDR family oxidoreductase [Phenylobacterium sp.]|nr:SDR family oxidoreductase [Phenylobacterium sp.]
MDQLLGPAGALGERMGVQITEASPERVVGTMPVEGNTQPYGLLHGGASCVLAESLGSVGAVLHGLQGSVQSSSARPFGRAAEPTEIASAVAFLASPRSGYTSGTVLMVDGGLSARAAA